MVILIIIIIIILAVTGMAERMIMQTFYYHENDRQHAYVNFLSS